MVFSSSTFIFVFLPVAILGYYLLHLRYRNTFLLFISLVFYAWGEPKFVLIMMLSILMNWGAAYLIEIFKTKKTLRKSVFICAISMNLAILFVFKYLNFVLSNLNRITDIFPQTNITLPIGISFFTFQAVSYVVDVYRGKVSVQKNPLNIGLYISFFPQLIAGPIVRYETIAAEIASRETTWSDFCAGVERFLRGVFKKILLANNLALVADKAFGTEYGELSMVMAWFGAITYTLQLYFDFCGYSDMAIGLGRMFGFHFSENFNYPYVSKSVSEFWQRWHISLGLWFKDYVYFPLGGSRVKTKGRHIFNLFIVWLLTGVWHGASWNFIFWGMLYFFIILIEKYVVHPDKFNEKSAKRIVWQVVAMLYIVLSRVLFRAEGLRDSMGYYLSLIGIGAPLVSNDAIFYIKEYAVVFIVAMFCCTPVLKWLKKKADNSSLFWLFDTLKVCVYCILLVFSVSYLVMGAHNPFIYFNF